ncbi:MAG: helix-turn-helix transcriptional regulator [Eggerthellaceae bacterium]|nr:helix-turn-helix transcriptional regulator [Eggerthellaceae bacterium]
MITYAYISLPRELGDAVRSARMEQGLTQTQLAQRSGCSQRFISELERGKGGAELGKALQVISALGLTVSLSANRGLEQSRQLVEQGIDRVREALAEQPRKRKSLSDILEG